MQPADLIGKRISQIRRATLSEMKKCGRDGERPPLVFVLENGFILLPPSDAEQPGKITVLDTLTGKISAFQ